jgi:hypothetical protein
MANVVVINRPDVWTSPRPRSTSSLMPKPATYDERVARFGRKHRRQYRFAIDA